ncbi:MAG: hypothetical protein WB766_08375 [Roseiarcus sp.]
MNTCHRLSRLKIIAAKNCRREQDIDDGAQAQSKHDAAGYASFGRRCGRLRENLGGDYASIADQFATDRFRRDRMTGQADSDRDLPGMGDRDRPELACGPPAIVMANLDARQAAKASIDSAGFGNRFFGRPQSSERQSRIVTFYAIDDFRFGEILDEEGVSSIVLGFRERGSIFDVDADAGNGVPALDRRDGYGGLH